MISNSFKMKVSSNNRSHQHGERESTLAQNRSVRLNQLKWTYVAGTYVAICIYFCLLMLLVNVGLFDRLPRDISSIAYGTVGIACLVAIALGIALSAIVIYYGTAAQKLAVMPSGLILLFLLWQLFEPMFE